MKKFFLTLLLFILSCNFNDSPKKHIQQYLSELNNKTEKITLIHPEGKNIKKRIKVPKGYKRVQFKKGAYGYYLRHLPLKKNGSYALYHDGNPKDPEDIYCAVINWSLGKKNLQQCADAAMRIRGEYLYDKGLYKQIWFNFLKDGKPRYYKTFAKKFNRKSFDAYLEYVFIYANTRSLHKQMKKAKWASLRSGDVLIQKGKPFGHAVTVMDTAIHEKTGEKIYLLSQGYMPAQDIQILVNPSNKKISPWYSTIIKDKKERILTPEWIFKKEDLRRF